MTWKMKFLIPALSVIFVIMLPDNNDLTAQVKSDASRTGAGRIFKAGAAASNITPFLGGGIIGGWSLPPATHIHDELHARCLVLDDGETRLALVVVDILGMSHDLVDEAKRLINEETSLPKENIIISGTHTHSATSALDKKPLNDHQKFMIRRIADVVRVGINNLEPARIGWGAGSVPQHVFVRRWVMKPGTPVPDPFGGQDKVRMNPGNSPDLLEPAGKPDPEVSFISVQSTGGRPIALFANYSLHYVGGVGSGHISADYFGMFADRIKELLNADRQNPEFVGMMSNGTSGDVNNNNYAVASTKRYQPYEKMRIVADDVAGEVLRVSKTIRYHDWVRLQAAQDLLTLKVRKPDVKMIARANMILSRPDTVKPYHAHEKVYAQRSLNLLKWPDQIDIVLQTFRIGDLGIATTPFETISAIGLELKEKSPLKPSFTISLAHGYYGYLPTPEQHKLGGYETWLGTNNVEVNASEKIVSKLLGLYAKLK